MDHFKMDFCYKIKYKLWVWKSIPFLHNLFLDFLGERLSSDFSNSNRNPHAFLICLLHHTNHFFASPLANSVPPTWALLFAHSNPKYFSLHNLCPIFSEMLSSDSTVQ